MLDMLFTFSKALIHVAGAIDEAYYEGKENEVERIELTSDQIVETMDIDTITACYASASIENFNIKHTEHILKDNYLKQDFDIRDVIVRKNCAYLKVRYAIPFYGGNKCYGNSFSINFMEPNNAVTIYGTITKNAEEKQVFKQIANELLAALSK